MKKIYSFLLMLICALTTAWAAPTDLPEITADGAEPVWYLIKNVRKQKYATYAGDDATMTQQANATAASFFYFTGETTESGLTVKIHNYAAGDKLCASYNSWTADGINWYFKVQSTGVSISNNADGSGNGTSWNDAAGNGQKVEFWNATDPGSAWEIVRVTDFSSVIDVEAAKTTAKAEIVALATATTNIYPATTSYEGRIDAVEAAGTSLAELNAAAAEINAIVTEYKSVAYAALAGKYFTIKTPARTNGYLKMSETSIVGTSAATSPANIWQFVPADDYVKIFNPYTNKYLGALGNASAAVAAVTSADAAAAYTLAVTTSPASAAANVKLTSEDKSAHMDGSSNLVRWDNGDASEWTVLEMSETDINAIVETYKTETISTLDSWATLTAVFSGTPIDAAKEAITAITANGYESFAAVDAEVENVTNAVAAKMFTFRNSDTASAPRVDAYLAANMSDNEGHGTQTFGYNAIWSLRHATGTYFYLYNELNKVYLGAPSTNGDLTAAPQASYSFEIVDAATNKAELKCNGQTLHLNNHTDGLLSNYDQDDAASRWYIETIDVASDIQEILDALNVETEVADVPAFGQYPKAAYDALVEARNTATTVEEVEEAITAFNLSKNTPLYFIKNIEITNTPAYVMGKAILYNGSEWRFDTADKYNKQMWMTIPTYTEANVPSVTSFDADNNTFYALSDYLTKTVMRNLPVQIVEIEGVEGGYNLQYGTTTNNSAHHAQQGGALVGWNIATAEGESPASAWNVEYIGSSYVLSQLTDEQLEALKALQVAYTAKAAYKNVEIGTAIGQYQGDKASLDAAIAAAEAILEKTMEEQVAVNVADITSATTALNNVAAFTINPIAKGKYYRIKSSATNAYLTAPASIATAMTFSADASASNIFYYDAEGHLLVYGSGYYIYGYNHARLTYKDVYAFEENKTGAAGEYSIKPGTANYWYNNNGTLNVWQGGTHANCNFIVEEVTELPVSITSAGYATAYFGVNVEIPENVKAYTVSISDYADLTEIESGIIPANVGVILEGAEGTHNFVITSDAAEASSALSGTLHNVNIAAEDGTTYYVFAIVEGKLGFYADECTNGTFYNNGNKGYLAITDGEGAASYSFRFPGTTGIEGVEAENGAVKGIYDLTGRRIDAITAPGIYIVDGVKVIVK